jgi:tol-pal system protein YbgF
VKRVPPPANVLGEGARGDYNSGKSDLAANDYAEFLRDYPDDPNAPEAQFVIGEIHLGQQKYDQAVMDFDAVLERYPENKLTPDAYFMKGMALKQSGHRDLAATEWKTLIRKYPHSERKNQAAEQLRAMGLSPGPTTAASRKKIN